MKTVESSSILTIDTTELSERPIFAFTSDIEWAPEWAIERLITVMDRYDVPLTPFVTHESFLLRQRYSTTAMRARVGVHPNFLETSSHGDTPNNVVDFVHALWPEATGFRSHCFFDNTQITAALIAKGFTFDSNLFTSPVLSASQSSGRTTSISSVVCRSNWKRFSLTSIDRD